VGWEIKNKLLNGYLAALIFAFALCLDQAKAIWPFALCLVQEWFSKRGRQAANVVQPVLIGFTSETVIEKIVR
jgi:hypothetical protein